MATTIVGTGKRDPHEAVGIIGRMATAARLTPDEARGYESSLDAKLGGESFVTRALAAVVEWERDAATGARDRAGRSQERIRAVGA